MSDPDLQFLWVLLLVGWLGLSLMFVSTPAWQIGQRLLRHSPDARKRRFAPWLAGALPVLGLAAPFSLVLRAYSDWGDWFWPMDQWEHVSAPRPPDASDYSVHHPVAFLVLAVASWGAFFASVPLFVVYWRARALDWRAPIAFAVSYALFLTWIAVDPDGVHDWFATWDFP